MAVELQRVFERKLKDGSIELVPIVRLSPAGIKSLLDERRGMLGVNSDVKLDGYVGEANGNIYIEV